MGTALVIWVGALVAAYAIDASRLYLTVKRLKAQADAAALAASAELDGTIAGTERAPGAASHYLDAGDGSVIEFAATPAGPWDSAGRPDANLVRVRVSRRVAPGLVEQLAGGASEATAESMATRRAGTGSGQHAVELVR